MDRNIITIDAYDWGNRVGGDDAPWRPADGTDNDRPFLYEGVFAHEYQHLLHGDQDPIEESWINEGLSDWTMWLTGYGIPVSHGNDASLLPENSLVNWGDQGDLEILADYGIAFEFMHYLYNHFGPGVMHSLFESQLQGIASVDEALAANGIHKSFADVYHDFAIARLILSDKPGHGRYNIPDVVDPVKLRNDDGTVNTQAFDTPGAPPWGSDYLLLNEPKKIKKFTFDGLDMLTLETQWTSVADPLDPNQSVLWSGGGDMQDRFAIFEATGGGTLSFLTLYDLEEFWDFGIVQVSTDNGATWTTLGNGDTTSDFFTDVPAIYDNLPGLTGVSGVDLSTEDPDNPSPAAWVPESYDLSAFSGPILIGLRFMSDESANGNFYVDPPNWYVDDVTVDGQLVSDGTDTAPFHDLTFYQPVDLNFTVDLVTITQGKKGPSYQVFHVFTDEDSERSRPVDIRKAMASCSDAVLIVTYDALQGQTAYAPYEVKTYQFKPHHPHDPPHHWRPRFPHWPHAPHWNMGH